MRSSQVEILYAGGVISRGFITDMPDYIDHIDVVGHVLESMSFRVDGIDVSFEEVAEAFDFGGDDEPCPPCQDGDHATVEDGHCECCGEPVPS